MLNLNGLATRIFGNLVDKYKESFLPIKNALPKAGIKVPFRTYMSLCFFLSLISYIISLIIVLAIIVVLKVSLLLSIAYCLFIPVLVSSVVFVLIFLYPIQKVSSRRKNIDANLPFVLIHMGSIAQSGIPPYLIFKLLSQFEEYGEVTKEIKKIVRNIETFGMDPITAIKETAKRTPSENFKQALLGLVTTTESGGSVKEYLKNTGDQALFDWRLKREKFIRQLSTYAEFYTGIVIAAPLFIIALFSVMAMIQPTIMGFGILEITRMSIYGLIPLINVGFLLFLRGVEVEI